MRKSSAVVWFNSDKTIDTKEDVVDSTSVSKDQYKVTNTHTTPVRRWLTEFERKKNKYFVE
jgi:hypothetical protein